MPEPCLVEEGKTLREVLNGGWDRRVRVFEADKMVRAFLVRSERQLVLIDTLLGPQCGQWLMGAVLEEGPQAPPLLVVNSHSDWDHYWGNQVLPAPIVGSNLMLERVLHTHGPAEVTKKQGDDAASYAAIVPTPPTVLVNGPFRLHGGDLTFQLFPTPGHRPDLLSVWIPEIRTLFPGDTMEDPFPLLDDSKGPALCQQQLASLRFLLELKPDWVLPCHAEPHQGDGLIRSNLAYVERLLSSGGDEELFPYPAPEADDFYRSEHTRNLAQAQAESGK